MADLNPTAKRIYNVSPVPVRLTLDDGTTGAFRLSGTECLQREFWAGGGRDGDDARYRLTTAEDNESVIVGREGADGWSLVGDVVEADRIEE